MRSSNKYYSVITPFGSKQTRPKFTSEQDADLMKLHASFKGIKNKWTNIANSSTFNNIKSKKQLFNRRATLLRHDLWYEQKKQKPKKEEESSEESEEESSSEEENEPSDVDSKTSIEVDDNYYGDESASEDEQVDVTKRAKTTELPSFYTSSSSSSSSASETASTEKSPESVYELEEKLESEEKPTNTNTKPSSTALPTFKSKTSTETTGDKRKRTKLPWTEAETKHLIDTYGTYKDDHFKWNRILDDKVFQNKRTKANLQDKVAWLRGKGLFPY